MKAKYILASCTLAIATLGACSETTTVTNDTSYENSMIRLTPGNGYGYIEFYDKDTKVMYFEHYTIRGICITPMFNADGTLKLYSSES